MPWSAHLQHGTLAWHAHLQHGTMAWNAHLQHGTMAWNAHLQHGTMAWNAGFSRHPRPERAAEPDYAPGLGSPVNGNRKPHVLGN